MRFLFFIAGILVTTLPAKAQDTKFIRLKDQPAGYAPKGFHISQVVDDLEDKTSIAEISSYGKKQKVGFQNGAAAAIKGYIERNVPQDKSTQPIALHISKIEADIKKEGGEWLVDARVMFTFYIGDRRVIEYNGKGHGQMDGDPTEYIEGFIRQAIENDLKKFDSWWSQNKGNVPTASAVKVNVSIGRTTDKPNCIVYTAQRPLLINDFTGPVEEDIPELAATFSGIGLGLSGQTKNGQIVLDIIITPYFDRTKSWFKNAGKNPRVLAHEQTHFDITAIKACELAEAIRNASLTQQNYEQVIGALQKQNAEESNAEESTYDTETNHGTIEEKQLEWERKIKVKVRESGCYN